MKKESIIEKIFKTDSLRNLSSVALVCAAFVFCCFNSFAQEKPAVAHFHHLHLNSTDPAAAIQFYTSKFDCERGRIAGRADGVRAQKSWLLFNKVKSAPAWEPVSAIWHFGWGAEDMKAAYEKQIESGTKFFEPLTDISEFTRTPGFYYAYVDGPDHALIELNTASHHHFGHIHLFSEDPVTAGEWYMKYFGATRRGNPSAPPSREPRFYKELQVGPSMSLMLDNVNIIIFPIQFSHKAYAKYWSGGKKEMATTKGRVVDHLAFSFDNLAEAVERMRRDGVKITEEITVDPVTKFKHAFVEGPDHIRIELVEGHATRQ
ncbi:MAG TPA: VOC family protein [Blastocatellia bacterium]|nr:VOC family protein [Blastocatellia bacterium]